MITAVLDFAASLAHSIGEIQRGRLGYAISRQYAWLLRFVLHRLASPGIAWHRLASPGIAWHRLALSLARPRKLLAVGVCTPHNTDFGARRQACACDGFHQKPGVRR